MNKTAVMKAAAHAGANSASKNAKALESAAATIQKQDAANKAGKLQVKAAVKQGVHTVERFAGLGAASTIKGFKGDANVFGVDARAGIGTVMVLGSLGAKLMKPKSTIADHTLALGEGVVMSYAADKFTQLGQTARTKWDSRSASISGSEPREVLVTPPAIGADDVTEAYEIPAGFSYATLA